MPAASPAALRLVDDLAGLVEGHGQALLGDVADLPGVPEQERRLVVAGVERFSAGTKMKTGSERPVFALQRDALSGTD
jgi:hypothetical protein